MQQIYNQAIRLLSYRPRSEKELLVRLTRFARNKRIGNYKEIVGKVLKLLHKEQRINDLEFAKWWIDQRNMFSPRGQQLLIAELRQKGVADALIDKALVFFAKEERDIFGIKRAAVTEQALAYQAAKSKANLYGKQGKEKLHERMRAFLLRRGFKYEVVKEVIANL